jgi:hypothetical protein
MAKVRESMYIQQPQKKKKCVYFLSVERKSFFCNTLFGIYPRIISNGAAAPIGPGPSHYRSFTITQILDSVGLLWTGDQPIY